MSSPGIGWRNRAALALFAVALAQMAGDVAGWRPLAGVAAAWGVSPRPKVFSDVEGLETFSSEFAFVWRDPGGEERRLEITPAVYSRLAGPYNRRNVYGAALAYAPRLPEELWLPVYCYGLGPVGPLRRELGLPAETPGLATEIVTRARGRDDRWRLDPHLPMTAVKPQSAYQFALFRWLLGLYLATHFALLVPWGPELFSREGVFPNASVSPLAGVFPNLLALLDQPFAVQAFLGVLTVAALAYAAGFARPALAILLWYGWTCLFNRNLLIANPGLPYVGLILVLSALVPRGEGLVARRGGLVAKPEWAMPIWVWRTAFYALMAGYTYSGLVKLGAPSWVDGEALRMLLTNPLARDGLIRELMLVLPTPLLKALTWGALAGEILALPLCLTRRGRAVAWLWMLLMHLGLVLVVDFADLTLGMIAAHLFVFDPAWLAGAGQKVRGTVFFDGVCVLCNASMRFLVDEDRERVLRFAPLQGETARGEPRLSGLAAGEGEAPGSVVYLRREGERTELFTRSDAILRILRDLGGFWRVLSWARVVPRFVRDPLYDFIARNRYRWFGRLEACRLPRPGEAELFLD